MKNSLNALIMPAIVLILTVGLVLPVFNTIQEERCRLAFSEVVESDLVESETASQALSHHSKAVGYLMKHPRQTLKNCLAYESENPESTDHDLIIVLAGTAYEQIRHHKLPADVIHLKQEIQNTDPELYQDLTTE